MRSYKYSSYLNKLKKITRATAKFGKKVSEFSKNFKEKIKQSYITHRFKANQHIKAVDESIKKSMLEGVQKSKKITTTIRKKYGRKVYQYWDTLGPGLTTGAADDDPAGIATYSQAGAKYGLKFLWTALITFPLMATVQEMCARIALVTRKGLAANIREKYSKKIIMVCTCLLLIANTFNIGADLGAMAVSTQLLFPKVGFVTLLMFFTLLSLGLQIFVSYPQYAKYLKYFALTLFSYVFAVLMIENINWGEILKHSICPSIEFSKDHIFMLCAILGTTISPYLFFWQSSHEVEENQSRIERITKLNSTEKKLRDSDVNNMELSRGIREMRIDVWTGMFISNFVMFFIIAATASTLFAQGITNIETAADAANALRPLAGENAYLLFTIGIIGSGLLAVPVLAGSASYAVSESIKARAGLNLKLKEAPIFYGVIILSMLVGFGMNFFGINPIKALIYSAVINGLIAPFILFFIVKISSDKKIMGYRVNHSFINFLGWTLIIVMSVVGIATIVSFFV